MYQLEMPDRSLIRRIQRITEWQDDNPRVLYGVFIPQHNAIYFSLDTAQYAILQPAPDRQDDAATNDSTLPTREGMEAVMQPAPYEANKRTGEVDNRTGVTVDKADVPADGEEGDLNG